MKELLKKFLERERNEIIQHKQRFIAIIVAFVASIICIFAFNTDEETTTQSTDPKKVVETADNKPVQKSKNKSVERKSILGLDKIVAENEIVNPFKVDIEKPPEVKNSEIKTDVKTINQPTLSIKNVLPKDEEKIILTLNGTAISGDKKMAIIQRNIVNKHNSKDEKKQIESLLLNVGDSVDGRKIIDIGKNFVAFDDGQKLYIQEALK
ncbi:MAG: hypothetical protein IJ728_12880 [Selenomonadaceae bacterium]|nr:hypothetical protein [Selenomonadaceae bacterium]